MGDETLLQWLSDVAVTGTILSCAYTVLATVLVIRFRNRIGLANAKPEPVTLLKPLCGTEPDLARRLAAFCAQDYAAPIQMVCGVQDRADGAIAAVEKVAAPAPRPISSSRSIAATTAATARSPISSTWRRGSAMGW